MAGFIPPPQGPFKNNAQYVSQMEQWIYDQMRRGWTMNDIWGQAQQYPSVAFKKNGPLWNSVANSGGTFPGADQLYEYDLTNGQKKLRQYQSGEGTKGPGEWIPMDPGEIQRANEYYSIVNAEGLNLPDDPLAKIAYYLNTWQWDSGSNPNRIGRGVQPPNGYYQAAASPPPGNTPYTPGKTTTAGTVSSQGQGGVTGRFVHMPDGTWKLRSDLGPNFDLSGYVGQGGTYKDTTMYPLGNGTYSATPPQGATSGVSGVQGAGVAPAGSTPALERLLGTEGDISQVSLAEEQLNLSQQQQRINERNRFLGTGVAPSADMNALMAMDRATLGHRPSGSYVGVSGMPIKGSDTSNWMHGMGNALTPTGPASGTNVISKPPIEAPPPGVAPGSNPGGDPGTAAGGDPNGPKPAFTGGVSSLTFDPYSIYNSAQPLAPSVIGQPSTTDTSRYGVVAGPDGTLYYLGGFQGVDGTDPNANVEVGPDTQMPPDTQVPPGGPPPGGPPPGGPPPTPPPGSTTTGAPPVIGSVVGASATSTPGSPSYDVNALPMANPGYQYTGTSFDPDNIRADAFYNPEISRISAAYDLQDRALLADPEVRRGGALAAARAASRQARVSDIVGVNQKRTEDARNRIMSYSLGSEYQQPIMLNGGQNYLTGRGQDTALMASREGNAWNYGTSLAAGQGAANNARLNSFLNLAGQLGSAYIQSKYK